MEEGKTSAANEPAADNYGQRLQDTEAELAAARDALAMVRADIERLKMASASILIGDAPTNEIQHRVRNLLTVVRSIFARSVENAASPEDLIDHFRGRLDALARYEVNSTRAPTGAIELENIVRDELLTTGFGDGPRITIDGPRVLLRDKPAELFGLAVHELVTNSIKFGALGDGNGKGALNVHWTVEDDILCFHWDESGVAVLSAAPMRRGFGRELIEQALPYEVAAETSFRIIPGGVSCSIRLGPCNRDGCFDAGTIGDERRFPRYD